MTPDFLQHSKQRYLCGYELITGRADTWSNTHAVHCSSLTLHPVYEGCAVCNGVGGERS